MADAVGAAPPEHSLRSGLDSVPRSGPHSIGMASATFQTRQVADAAGVNVETLRYYERRGLLRAPKRGRGGYREYTQEAIEIVRFVKRAQALGFTLEEIQELLALRRPRADRCATVQRAATAKIEEIDAKIRSLAAMRGALEQLAIACSENAGQLHCPLIERLAEASKEAP